MERDISDLKMNYRNSKGKEIAYSSFPSKPIKKQSYQNRST